MTSHSQHGVVGLFHAGVTVSSIDASLTFYRDTLGLELVYDRETKAAYLGTVLGLEAPNLRIALLRVGPPDAAGFVELVEYRDVDRRAAGGDPWHPGSAHVCIYVRGIEALHRDLLARGYAPRSVPVAVVAGPNTGARILYVSDPDGHWVELFERPNDPDRA
jgi:catechol 2,3-dioxygenase-like lactoylglutathione lyase family enzyme